MKSLFTESDRHALVRRLESLTPDAPRQWGTMSAAQMLCHCAIALETGTGDRPMQQKLIGKLLMPFFKKKLLGEQPFQKNSPTDPTFVVKNDCDFTAERARLVALIERFVQRGTASAGTQVHSFFGKLTGEQWGELMYKHIDHHLQQFNA